MFETNTTRTIETEELYRKRAASLIKRARRDLKLDDQEPLGPREFAAWLVEQRATWKQASWRLYRSAAVHHFQKDSDPETLEALDFLRETHAVKCQKDSQKTSSTKLKKLPASDFQKLTDYLRKHRGKWNRQLLDWMVSGMLTGLRPQEWAEASITNIDGEPALVVVNAKNTNGRAHGMQRTLLLGALADEEVTTIRDHLERARSWRAMEQFQDLYSGCSQALHQISRKIWPKRTRHITLYSCRHQFTANAKASGFGTMEIAAMMGHGVDTTATKHYGRKAAGNEMLRVRPLPDDVAKVKSKFAAGTEPQTTAPDDATPDTFLQKPAGH